MTSKIVVNNIEADAGVSTVTFNSNVQRGSSNLHSTGLNVNDTFVHSTGIALGAGSTIGAVTGVTTYFGDGSQLTGIDATKIITGNTQIQTIDTGSDGHIKATTEGTERLRILSNGHIAIGDDIANDTGMFKVIAADGQSDDQYVGQFKNLEATTNRNWGLLIQAGSSSTDESLRIRNGANNADHLTVRGDGIVTKPNTPAFHVSRQGGNVSSNNYVIFDHVDYNNGSHYDNSNGRFTAPVTGIYFFSAWNYTGSTSAFYLRINSTTFGEYAWSDDGGCATWVCPMTANQYARIYTKYTWRGTSDYHNAFCGYLIG